MTILEAEELFRDELYQIYDEAEARSLSYYVTEYVSGFSRAILSANKSKVLSETEEASVLLILNELKTGNPVQYVLGETEFYGLRFKVNPSVLIPRPETEELVDWVLREVKGKRIKVESVRSGVSRVKPELGAEPYEESREAFRILDIGTGSGCIPIALKKHLPQGEVFGLDISEEALETAMGNAVLNRVEVKFVQGDIFEDVSYELSAISSSPFNLIISNPPYITQKEKVQMHQNVLAYEPDIALFVPDEDPLVFYKAIADFAIKHLLTTGALFFEINEAYGDEITTMLTGKGFAVVELRKDMQGKNRMVKAISRS